MVRDVSIFKEKKKKEKKKRCWIPPTRTDPLGPGSGPGPYIWSQMERDAGGRRKRRAIASPGGSGGGAERRGFGQKKSPKYSK